MRRISQLSVLCLMAGALSACSQDQVVQTEDVPTAGVRFINAVPDSGGSAGFDFRFVDIVENNAQFKIAFRNNIIATTDTLSGGRAFPGSTMIEYKNTRAGQRHFRIFLSDPDQAVAQVVIKDTTVTIEAGKRYTALLWGNARGGAPAMRLTWVEDTPPDPGTNVAIRVLNTTGAPIDVRNYPINATLPAAATWSAVGALSASSYVNAAPGTYRINVQPAGGGAPMGQYTISFPAPRPAAIVDPSPLTGAAATVDVEALPGTTVAGSAITAIVWPRSVAGSKAPQGAAFNTPAVSFVWDRRPPRACSPLC